MGFFLCQPYRIPVMDSMQVSMSWCNESSKMWPELCTAKVFNFSALKSPRSNFQGTYRDIFFFRKPRSQVSTFSSHPEIQPSQKSHASRLKVWRKNPTFRIISVHFPSSKISAFFQISSCGMGSSPTKSQLLVVISSSSKSLMDIGSPM